MPEISPNPTPNKPTTHLHFIGIGGIGMSGLARIMLERECSVSGSDLSLNYVTEGLVKKGAQVFVGHSADYIAADTTVIYSSDIKQENPEYQTALALKCTLLHRSDLLAALMDGSKTLAVAGTHGKTTTSALLTAVLLQAGLDPSFAIGGILPQLQANAGAGKGDYFVAEADESDGTFLKYAPHSAIVTNIDLDHMNYFGSEEQLVEAFSTFMAGVKEHFWCGDDARLTKLQPHGVSYGFTDNCQLRLSNFRQAGWRSCFSIEFRGKKYEGIEIGLVGEHNALNAAAVFGLCLTLNISQEAIRTAFRLFGGVLRRCEKKAERQGVLLLDDYAHHPTEISATLKGVRRAVEERRLIAVFQPHRYTRTRDCLGTFAGVFDEADEVIITDIFSAGESPIPEVSVQALLSEIKRARYIPRTDLASILAKELVPHDVLISLGAGDITKLSSEILQQAPRKLKVGLVFGGRSTEHEVSIRSARYVVSCLNSNYYDVSYFGITKEGKWLQGEAFLKENVLHEDASEPISQAILTEILACDVLFPVLHGPLGEDGTIQGFFEMLGKAYVGCDSCASAIAMDKAFTKKLMLAQGIPTVPFIAFTVYEWRDEQTKILSQIDQLTYPLFVKPVHLGSSVGIKKVNNRIELLDAIRYALEFDVKVLVEEGIDAREIEFSLLGNGNIRAFPPGEICSDGTVYTYDSKYGPNSAKTMIQANLPPELIQEGISLAETAFKAIGGTGMSRVDFFLDKQNKFWLNEVNPIPGFTAISLYPKMCEANGLTGVELIDRLLILAMERKRRRRCIYENTSF